MFLIKISSGTYYIKYKQSNGKYTQVSTSSKKRSIANRKLKKFINNRQSTNVIELISNKVTVGEYFDINIYKGAFLAFVRIIGKNRLLNSITENDIITFINVRQKEYRKHSSIKLISPATINTELAYLRLYFKKAIKSGYISINPIIDIPFLKIPKKLFNVFDVNDRRKLLNVISNKRLFNIVRFTLLTGCRRNEVLNLQWNNIDFNKRIVFISSNNEFHTKTGDIRTIPMNDELKTLLSTISRQSKYVFCKENGFPYCNGYVSKEFKKCVRKAGLNDSLHFHSLRHTVVTELVKNDVSINKVKEFMGHRSINTTLKYTHLNVEDYRSVADKIVI